MPTLQELNTALINADRAGDTAAARTLAAEIQRQRASIATSTAVSPAMGTATPTPAQQPLSRMDKISQGFHDIGAGATQLLSHVLPNSVVQAGADLNNYLVDKTGLGNKVPAGGVDQMVRDREQKYQAQRAAQGESGFDGYRTIGNVASGAAAVATAPAAAGTIGGGALIGAATGALNPVTDENYWSAKAKDAAIGAAGGAVMPAAARAAKVLRAGLVDPFTPAGRDKIVGRLINKSATDPDAAIANMQANTGSTPGFQPTVGQASNDAGLASLERGARAIDPAGFGAVDMNQRGAMVNALRGIAKTPEDRAAAVAAVDANARDLYGKAFQESVDVTPTLTALASRPSVQAAEKRAIGLADEMGIPFNARLEDMRPKTINAGMRQLPDSSVTSLAPEYNPLTMTTHNVPVETSVPSGSVPNLVSIPPVDSVPVRDMHTLKMGMDALLSDPTQGIAGREAAALKATRNRLLDQLPESYQVARQAHIEMNKPVNQMDIGQALHDRFVPALADGSGVPFKTRADSYATALRNGDQLAKNVTGLKNATMDSIMEPSQMATLNGIADDAAMIGKGQNLGRGVGSDTIQKMAMSNLIGESGLPSWIGSVGRIPGGWLKTAGEILYTKNDEAMRHLLADVLKDPARATQAMQAAGVPPSKYADILRAAAQSGAIGVANTPNQ